MTCDVCQSRLRDDPDALDPAVETHLDECVDCAQYAAELAAGAEVGGDAPRLDGLLDDVEARLAAERGPLAWLRSRSTAVRALLAVAVGLGLPILFGVARLRVDASVYPALRFGAIAVVFGALVAAALWLTVRPLHRPPLPAGVSRGLAGAAALAVIAAAVLPIAHTLHPASLLGVGDDFARRALACFLVGLSVGVPVALAALAVGRARPSWLGSPWLALFAGAVAGNLALHLHCPLVARQHLVAGHATVLVPCLLVLALIALRWRSARPAR